MIGTEISGRTLGIVGMGRIGRVLAGMAAGFGMTVRYHNRSRLPPEREAGALFHASDETFLPLCEVLSLNAPGGAQTRHWLDARRIALLPPGAIVVNAGRGTLIDDAALIAALRSGHVAAAGLDVYDGEPRVDPGYLALENVVLLPHLGSATATAREAMGHLALDGILTVLAGGTPANLVPP
jgi:lactate dehydrogenase-like 2-hydroxyacid dehydrogenase